MSIPLEQEALISRRQQRAYEKDTTFYRIVVSCLGGTTVVCAIGAIYLSCAGRPVPDILMALGSGAIGAIAGVLTDTR